MGGVYTAAAVITVVSAGAAASSRHPAARWLGRFVLAALTLGCLALTAGAIYVGVTNNWTSDGPAMLFVMLAVVFFGAGALVFGGMLVTSFGVAAVMDAAAE